MDSWYQDHQLLKATEIHVALNTIPGMDGGSNHFAIPSATCSFGIVTPSCVKVSTKSQWRQIITMWYETAEQGLLVSCATKRQRQKLPLAQIECSDTLPEVSIKWWIQRREQGNNKRGKSWMEWSTMHFGWIHCSWLVTSQPMGWTRPPQLAVLHHLQVWQPS